jgi:hypothetical protein
MPRFHENEQSTIREEILIFLMQKKKEKYKFTKK